MPWQTDHGGFAGTRGIPILINSFVIRVKDLAVLSRLIRVIDGAVFIMPIFAFRIKYRTCMTSFCSPCCIVPHGLHR